MICRCAKIYTYKTFKGVVKVIIELYQASSVLMHEGLEFIKNFVVNNKEVFVSLLMVLALFAFLMESDL